MENTQMEQTTQAIAVAQTEAPLARYQMVRNAARSFGERNSFYDGMITATTLPGKLVCGAVWGMSKKQNAQYLDMALESLPEGFSGKLLEVPVGTGVLSMPLYKNIPQANITCMDCSANMMDAAERRAAAQGLENVHFVQGDVSKLPFDDASFDLVLSLNGFHAFEDKEAAWRETYRVLKPGGIFCGSLYVREQTRRTDWFVRHYYTPQGYFAPPFETAASLHNRLNKLYGFATVKVVESLACFHCIKKQD